MKKILLSLMLVALCASASYAANDADSIATANEQVAQVEEVNPHLAPRGYRGFAEIDPWFTNTTYILNVKTTHGFQFNHGLFVGGGIGYYDDFLPDGKKFLPIYAAIQSNVGKNLAQFTYGGKLGFLAYHRYDFQSPSGDIKVSESAGFSGWYLNLNLGLRLGFCPDFALTLKPEIELYFAGMPIFCSGINIGFEF